MMVACVLKTIEVSNWQGDAKSRTRAVIREMDLSVQRFKGLPREVDDTVGVSKGDMVLCSLLNKGLSVVGIIDTIQLVGTKVYQRGNKQHRSKSYNKTMTAQEETVYGKAGAWHGGDQRLSERN